MKFEIRKTTRGLYRWFLVDCLMGLTVCYSVAPFKEKKDCLTQVYVVLSCLRGDMAIEIEDLTGEVKDNG